jgi:hypothetical protein
MRDGTEGNPPFSTTRVLEGLDSRVGRVALLDPELNLSERINTVYC